MNITKHIDWLNFTCPQAINPEEIFPMITWLFAGSGFHGYARRFFHPATGAVLQTGATDPAMGHHIQLSGDALQAFRLGYGGTDAGIINRIVAFGAKSSRIDLAINLHHCLLTSNDLKKALDKGLAQTRAREWRKVEGTRDNLQGETCYIGGKLSDRQFRAYDKAAEMGIVDGEAWIRLELQLRRLRANGALQSCARNGVAETITGHISDFLQWDNAEYNIALSGPSSLPDDIPRRETNTRQWLLRQVALPLARQLCIDPAFEKPFWIAVNAERDRLTGLSVGSTLSQGRS